MQHYDDDRPSDPRARKAIASVAARMRQHDERQEREAEEQRELDARRHDREQDALLRSPYDWDEADIVGGDVLHAEESVAARIEEQGEDRGIDDDDEILDDGNRDLPAADRAVRNVRRLMEKRHLLGDEGHEQEILDSLPGDDDAEMADRVKKVMPTRSAVEMTGDETADEPDEELREMIAAQELDEDDDDQDDDDDDDDDMGPGLRSGGLS